VELLTNLEPNPVRVIVTVRPIVHGDDRHGLVTRRSGDRLGQIGRKRRDAALSR
jgi:hypothetical protein